MTARDGAQADLFGAAPRPRARYPAAPGAKERGGTSEEAATAVKGRAALLRVKVEKLYRDIGRGGLTADEAARALHESPWSIRPRVSELFAARRLAKTPRRRRNASGASATVFVHVDHAGPADAVANRARVGA